MFEAQTAGGALVTIVAKHVTSVMIETAQRLRVTLSGGDVLTIGDDYTSFVAKLKANLPG